MPPLVDVLTNSSSSANYFHISSYDWAWKIHEVEAIHISGPYPLHQRSLHLSGEVKDDCESGKHRL